MTARLRVLGAADAVAGGTVRPGASEAAITRRTTGN
ncbi:MAG: hypothetical protein QOI95_1994 [Acidimicrobiaceae bacterium]|jgi:hypothetical protein